METLAVVAGFGKPDEVAKSKAKHEYFISTLKRAASSVPALSAAASASRRPAGNGTAA